MSSNTWNLKKVRDEYISFFVNKGHTFVPSSSVIPYNDETLLFANSGMTQFKAIFLGKIDPKSDFGKLRRAANSQKCIRAGGKHNDLDDVGKDVYHHTFFEMMGNWSFGDYFKEEAIEWAWELLTQVYGLDPKRIYASYFCGNTELGIPPDEEAKELWLKKLPPEHVLAFGMKENFWEMGDTGPCGPCSEIHYDKIGGRDASKLVNADDPTVIEIWNLVFMQYNRESKTLLKPLPAKHVDTGMGLERVTAILANVPSNYDIDIFQHLFAEISKVTNPPHPYTGKVGKEDTDNVDMAYRVIADHIRTLTFALSDGALPSSEGRGYILRRILRRAVRYGRQILRAKEPFFHKLVHKVVELMGDAFPELTKEPSRVIAVLKQEELRFDRTLDRGINKFQNALAKLTQSNVFPGKTAFKLYSTFGFPLDLIQIMAEEKNLKVDLIEYDKAKEEHSRLGNAALYSSTGGRSFTLDAEHVALLKSKLPTTNDQFKYSLEPIEASVVAIFVGKFVETYFPSEKEGVSVVFNQTNFYPEQGGQTYDIGNARSPNQLFVVKQVQVFGGYVLHSGSLEEGISLSVGEKFTLQVNQDYRKAVASNHTSTHLVNLALKKVISPDVQQKGSLVLPDKFRFDFNSPKQATFDQLSQIDRMVTDTINRDLPVYSKEIPLSTAKEIRGLQAVFGEVYPDPVRVVSIGQPIDELLKNTSNPEWENYSIELCGGTHLSRTSHALCFTVVAEEALSVGIRRLTAVTGQPALDALSNADKLETTLKNAMDLTGDALSLAVTEITSQLNKEQLPASRKIEFREKLSKLQDKLREEAKTNKNTQAKSSLSYAEKVVDDLKKVSSAKFYVGDVDVGFSNVLLTDVAKKIQESCPDVAVLLLSSDSKKGKMCIVAQVPPSLTNSKSFKADQWAMEAAKAAGGKGGGKSDKAQGVVEWATEAAKAAGGKEGGKSDELKQLVKEAAIKYAKSHLD